MKKLFVALVVGFALVLLGHWYLDRQVISSGIDEEIVVDFKDNVSQAYIDELGKKLNVHFVPESKYSDVDKVYVGHYYGNDEEGVLKALNKDDEVEAADRDTLYSIPENENPALIKRAVGSDGNYPNDPMRNRQWNMTQVHLQNAWLGKAGEGVIVAVIDTGVSHVEDLANTKFVPGYNFVDDNDKPEDGNAHGTHVAGTVAQSTNNGIGVVGIAYKASIMPIKVLSDRGSGTVADIVEGIDWSVAHGAKVINMSLGGGHSNKVFANAVKRAHDKGVFVACAAGNSATGHVSYPAAYPGAVAVAATQPDEKTTFYSNWGKEIAIAAPGGNTRDFGEDGGVIQNTIYQGKMGYYAFNGTSMASPHIAGAAAMVMSEGVKDPDKVLKVLQKTAQIPKGMDGKGQKFREHYGAGIVDIDSAVKMAQRRKTTTHTALYFLLGAAIVGYVMYKRRKKQ